jgi:cytochrome c oxidase assembly factor CtaG/putative copper export protein
VSRILRLSTPALVLAVAFGALIAALVYGGGAAPLSIGDPGASVRFGLPLATVVVYLSAATTIGALVLALWAFNTTEAAYAKAIDVAAGSAMVLTVASAVTGIFTFLNVSQTSFSAERSFGTALGFFFTEISLGQAWLSTTLIAAVVAVLCFAVTNQTALFFVGLGAVGTLVPMALSGHSAGISGHAMAITSLGLHIVFVSAWLGGLLVLVLLQRSIDPARLPAVIARYSTIALVSFIVVVVSGVANAVVRLGSWDALFETPYGMLVLAKAALFLVLGFFGLWQRGFLIGRLAATSKARYFWFFATVELAVMGAASGVAAGLSRTATPVVQSLNQAPTPAEILTGDVLPPELTLEKYFTSWNFDLIWLLATAFGIFFYLVGVRRLKRRGDKWPVMRTVSWVSGMLLLFYVTNGGINSYEMYLFSAHMAAHMTLGMMVPILLVPGAPVTLAMRAVLKRTDGSRGGREWILIAVHSKYAGFISNPAFATINFVGSLWLFYYSPLFRWATEDHIGHEWMIVHFLIAGYLFVQSLIGIDPVPGRLSYPFRLLQLLIAMTLHAFFGLAIMSGDALLLADWYGAMGRTWGVSPLQDQQNGGGIAWSVGEIPNAIMAIAIAIQWNRSDAKLAKREDRNADRTGDAELNAYNEMLTRTAKRDVQVPK